MVKSANRRRLRFVLAAMLTAALSFAACGDEVQVDNGLTANVRVANAQFQDRDFPVDTNISADAAVPVQPAASDGGVVGPPGIVTIDSQNNSVKRGTINKSLRVVVDPGATTVAVGLAGQRGYWLSPVTIRSVEFAPSLELTVTLEFDRSLAIGPARLWFAAANAAGQYGAPRPLDLVILDDAPRAAMVVSLDWTQNVDLDLVVQRPDGTLLTNKATRSAGASADSPKIDIDSNSACVLDGHREENAIFTSIPVGAYAVYVRLAAACGVPETGWRVRLLRDGQQVSEVHGATYAYETTLPNAGPSGPGRLALQFNIGG